MSKGLERLKELTIKLCENCPYNKPNMDGDVCSKCEETLSDIKKELKELEERREMMKRFNEACVPMIIDNETEKKLKEYEEIKTYMQQYGIENIEELRRVLHNDWVVRQKFKTDTANISRAFEIIKECLIVNDKGKYIEIACEFSTPNKEKYDLLKKALL